MEDKLGFDALCQRYGIDPNEEGSDPAWFKIGAHHVEGRCAFCICGNRLELPHPPRRKRGRDFRILYLRCYQCIRTVVVQEEIK